MGVLHDAVIAILMPFLFFADRDPDGDVINKEGGDVIRKQSLEEQSSDVTALVESKVSSIDFNGKHSDDERDINVTTRKDSDLSLTHEEPLHGFSVNMWPSQEGRGRRRTEDCLSEEFSLKRLGISLRDPFFTARSGKRVRPNAYGPSCGSARVLRRKGLVSHSI